MRAAKILPEKNNSGTAIQQQSFGGCQQESDSNGQGKNKQKGNLVQHVFSTRNSNERIRKHSSIDKKIIFWKRGSKIATCEKIKTLCGDMENSDKGFGNFRTCGKIQNTFQKEPSPTKNSRNPSPPLINLDQRYQVQVEIDNIWRREPYAKPSHLKEEFLSNVFLVGKKGG